MNILQNDDAGVSVRGLTKRFGTATAVDDLSFDVMPGHVTGFLGPNGAGKSTTLQMILGLTAPDAGTALVAGAPLSDHPNPAAVAGSLLGTERLLPGLTVDAHLEWAARLSGLTGDERTTRVAAVLAEVGLESAATRRISALSLGMRQRLGLAAAILTDPQVLLLDEPLNGLDPEGITWMRTFLKRFAASGRTVLFSSHLLTEMALTADHVVIIRAGRLVADLPLADLVSHAQAGVVVRGPDLSALLASQAEAGRPSTPTPDGTGAVIADAEPREIFRDSVRLGVDLDELRLDEPGLEEVFLRLTTTRKAR